MVDLPLVFVPELFASVLAEGGCAPPRPNELAGAAVVAGVVMAGADVPPENKSDGVLVAAGAPRPKEKPGVAEVVVVAAAGVVPKEKPVRVVAAVEAGATETVGRVKPPAAGAVVLVARPKLKLLVVVAGAAGVVALKLNPLPGALVAAGWPRVKPPPEVLPVPKLRVACWGWAAAWVVPVPKLNPPPLVPKRLLVVCTGAVCGWPKLKPPDVFVPGIMRTV